MLSDSQPCFTAAKVLLFAVYCIYLSGNFYILLTVVSSLTANSSQDKSDLATPRIGIPILAVDVAALVVNLITIIGVIKENLAAITGRVILDIIGCLFAFVYLCTSQAQLNDIVLGLVIAEVVTLALMISYASIIKARKNRTRKSVIKSVHEMTGALPTLSVIPPRTFVARGSITLSPVRQMALSRKHSSLPQMPREDARKTSADTLRPPPAWRKMSLDILRMRRASAVGLGVVVASPPGLIPDKGGSSNSINVSDSGRGSVTPSHSVPIVAETVVPTTTYHAHRRLSTSWIAHAHK